jgi:hypothetical protein
MRKYEFVQDRRLGIPLPVLHKDWADYTELEQADILHRWEQIRGRIPDHVKRLESEINKKQAELNDEDDFEHSCQLNWEIAELASCINDLLLWYRINQEIDAKRHL